MLISKYEEFEVFSAAEKREDLSRIEPCGGGADVLRFRSSEAQARTAVNQSTTFGSGTLAFLLNLCRQTPSNTAMYASSRVPGNQKLQFEPISVCHLIMLYISHFLAFPHMLSRLNVITKNFSFLPSYFIPCCSAMCFNSLCVFPRSSHSNFPLLLVTYASFSSVPVTSSCRRPADLHSIYEKH